MANAQNSPEELFRDSLADVVKVAEDLEPICSNVGELIQVCSLALSNDGQLKLLMADC